MSFQPISQQGAFEELDAMGSDLSKVLHCPVRYCESVYSVRKFECSCLITFPEFAVKIAHDSGNWEDIIKHHNGC